MTHSRPRPSHPDGRCAPAPTTSEPAFRCRVTRTTTAFARHSLLNRRRWTPPLSPPGSPACALACEPARRTCCAAERVLQVRQSLASGGSAPRHARLRLLRGCRARASHRHRLHRADSLLLGPGWPGRAVLRHPNAVCSLCHPATTPDFNSFVSAWRSRGLAGSPCTSVWTAGAIAYRCRTCQARSLLVPPCPLAPPGLTRAQQTNDSSAICVSCFKAGGHEARGVRGQCGCVSHVCP